MEIKYINDKELVIGKNRCIVLNDNIIFITAIDEQTDEIACLHEKGIAKLKEHIKGNVSFLIDLNLAGKSTPEARKIWNKLSEDRGTNKVALYGMHPVARVLASFVMTITNKNEMDFFKTKEAALAWLIK